MNDKELDLLKKATRKGNIQEVIFCIEMCNSIICYGGNVNDKYLDKYKTKLGNEIVEELFNNQLKDIKCILKGVHEDSEGVVYNSIVWKE